MTKGGLYGLSNCRLKNDSHLDRVAAGVRFEENSQ